MPEIAKCPLCRQEPTIRYWGNSEDPSYIYCCGAMLSSIELWNRYAAAIELTEAEVWFKEVLDIKSYIGFDEKNPKSSKNEEYNRIWEESYNDLNNAYEHAIAVFK